MGEQRRQHTREFKVEAVRLLEESDRPRAQVVRELGIVAVAVRAAFVAPIVYMLVS